MSDESPTIAAGAAEVKHCPFCGIEFTEFLTLNVKHNCPLEGGCGRSFSIYAK